MSAKNCSPFANLKNRDSDFGLNDAEWLLNYFAQTPIEGYKSLPLDVMRAHLARLMLGYIYDLAGELEATLAQLEKNTGHTITE